MPDSGETGAVAEGPAPWDPQPEPTTQRRTAFIVATVAVLAIGIGVASVVFWPMRNPARTSATGGGGAEQGI